MDYWEQLRETGDNGLMLGYLLKEVEKSQKKESNMGVRVNWSDSRARQRKFSDLNPNDAFRIVGSRAVYIKVVPGTSNIRFDVDHRYRGTTGGMLEIATGKVFAPTNSVVEPIEVEINVGVNKPHIY